jgi:hypothetical protein
MEKPIKILALLIGVLVLIGTVGVAGLFIFKPNLGVTMKGTPVTASRQATLTLNQYLALQDGMTYSQVRDKLLGDGEEVSRNNIGQYTTVMYVWKNKDGSSVNVIFQNDQLVSKSQFGLR